MITANSLVMKASESLSDEAVMRHALEQIVWETCGPRSEIAAIERTSFDASTSYACDVLTVRLGGGDQLCVFLKDFGFSRIPKDGADNRRERELGVYRELLALNGLGTARYYGSVWDKPRGRFWLFLEYVEATPVRYSPVENWIAAAGWLGRLHGFFAQHVDRLKESGFLLTHDEHFFMSKAELALHAVAQVSEALAGRLDKALNGYDERVLTMASQPRTLVHGSYRPRNILVQDQSGQARICPIDWELAAVGSGLYDFAFVADGFVRPELDVMWDAYRAEAGAYGLAIPERQELQYVIDCFRLHKIVKSLGECVESKFSEAKVAKIVGMAEALSKLTP